MATTTSHTYIANSTDAKWTQFDIRIQFNTHAEGYIVASTEALLSVAEAQDLIERLHKAIEQFKNQ